MDSPIKAIKWIFLWLPLEIISKIVEGIGIVYALLEYPFQKGKRKAQSVYNKLNG